MNTDELLARALRLEWLSAAEGVFLLGVLDRVLLAKHVLEGQDQPGKQARQIEPVDDRQLARPLDLHRVPYSPSFSSISTSEPTGRVA